MYKVLTTAVATVLLATSAIGTSAVADQRHHSRFNQQDRVVQNYCKTHRDNSCRDWDRNRNNWDESHYQSWYRDHYRHRGFGSDSTLAAIFGFTAGVIVGQTAGGDRGNSHVEACEDRYRSYDRRTDQFFGYDGRHHYCML